jgi:hypothetical protein
VATAPKTLLNPLNWQMPLVDAQGFPTLEFQKKWAQQTQINGGIPDLSSPEAISAALDLLYTTPGGILVRGSTLWGGLASPNDATKFLNGDAAPAYAHVKDSDLSTSDIATNDVSIAKHGFAPKAPNDATKFLNGVGAYTVPAGGGGGGGAPAFLLPPPYDPARTTSAGGGGIFIGRFFVADSAFTLTGVKTWLRSATSTQIYAGLYDATATAGLLTGATLLAQGPAQVPTFNADILIPFTAPQALVAGNMYWAGIGFVGGTFNTAAFELTPARYFFNAAPPLPGIGPSDNINDNTNFSCWGY